MSEEEIVQLRAELAAAEDEKRRLRNTILRWKEKVWKTTDPGQITAIFQLQADRDLFREQRNDMLELLKDINDASWVINSKTGARIRELIARAEGND